MKFYGLNIGGVFGGWSDLDDFGLLSANDVCDSLWEYSDGECREVKIQSPDERNC